MIRKSVVSLVIGLSLIMLGACNQNTDEQAGDRFSRDVVDKSMDLGGAADTNPQQMSTGNRSFGQGHLKTGRTEKITVPTDGIQNVGNGYLTIEHNSYMTTIPSKKFPHSKYIKRGQYSFYKESRPGQQKTPQKAVPGQQFQPQPKQAEPSGNEQKQTTQTQGISSIESRVIELTNEQRRKHGLNELQADAALSNVAKTKSNDMRDKKYFSHTSPTYGSPFDMIRDFGISYKSAGENIAMGQTTAEQVVNSWMNSEGHRKNILNPNFTHIGVGHSGSGNYWTQMFIQK